MKYRAAIVGCGRIGADLNPPGIGSSRLGSHAAAYTSSARVDLVAACDVDAARREGAQTRWRIPHVYAEAREMLEREAPDIVSICTPPEARGKLPEDLLADGMVKGVLVEKPLGWTLNDAGALLASARASSAIVAVNYVRRYAPVYRDMAAAIRQGTIGRVQVVRGLYTKGIVNNGGHMIDLLRLYFGEPRDVQLIADAIDEAGDPTVSFRMWFDGGIEATVHGLDHSAGSIFELDIIGTMGRLRFSDLGHRMERWTVEDTIGTYGFRQFMPEPRTADAGLSTAIPGAIDNLLDCLESGSAPFGTVDDAYATLAIALRVKEMAALRDPVRVLS